MKTVSVAMLAAIAGGTKLKKYWRVTLKDGTVLGFTDHDRKGLIDAVSYLAQTGYSATDVASGSALAVDNMEVHGILVGPAITEATLNAGIWDYAAVSIFEANWADFSMGTVSVRDGHLGQVTIKRGMFQAELLGLTNAYSVTMLELDSASCRTNLFSARCGLIRADFLVTSALTGVNPDGLTLYDTARLEAGPAAGIAILGVSTAENAIVTMASAGTFRNGDRVTLAGILGPTLLNQVTTIRGLSGATFETGIDTRDTGIYPGYISGGSVTFLDGSGFFDFGVIKMLTGPNAGLSMEVKSYVPKQITLQLPFPQLCEIGDDYELEPGCDKTFPTCRDRYLNWVNFRGEHLLPGRDAMVQVAHKE